MHHVTQRCTVQAEDGVVVLECGHALVTLDPAIAQHAGAKLQDHAEIARAQQMLPRELNECGEVD